MKASLLRDVRPRLAAEHAGHLVPAARGRRGASSATARCGDAHNWSLGLAAARRVLRAERRLRAATGATTRTSWSSATRALRHARRAAHRAWAADRLQPARLAPRHARGRPRTVPAAVAGRGGAARDRPRRVPARPTSSSRTRRRTPRFFRRAFGLADERVAVALVGAEEPLFRPGWQPPEPFHVLFVGKLIPLHGLETILAAAALAPEIPFRVVGDGQLAPLLDDRPAERRARSVDRRTRSCRTAYQRRGARSASSARARRRRA